VSDAEREAQKAQIVALMNASIPPRAVADAVVRAVLEDRFFVFSHPDPIAGVEARSAEIRRSAWPRPKRAASATPRACGGLVFRSRSGAASVQAHAG
jgi:hypothetical protein